MKNVDTMQLKGRLDISLNGEIVRTVDNLVVTAGKSWVAARMSSASAAVMSHMAIGTGATAAAVGDTTLQTEVARVALGIAGGTSSTNTINFTATIPADTPNITAPATTAVSEAAVLNAASAGTMLARTVFAVVNKGELDSMTISWTITIS